MNWFIQQSKIVEQDFAKNLKDVEWANNEQDIFEHWDLKGLFKGKVSKFDVKGMKKFNRSDESVQDKMVLVELRNKNGKPGWIYGKADYIAFKRNDHWLIVNREELLKFTEKNKGERESWSFIKKPYAIYDREKFGNKDLFLWIPFEDIEKLEDTHKVENK